MSQAPQLDIERITSQELPSTSLGRKEHYSKFHVIWSSNVRPTTVEEGQEIVNQMDHVFVRTANDHPSEFFKFSLLGKKGTFAVDPHQWNTQNIKTYKIKFVIEKGSHPKGGRVHLHAILWVVHYTYLQIDSTQLKRLLCTELEHMNELVKGCYLKIQWIPSSAPLENYIGKSPFGGSGLSKTDEHLRTSRVEEDLPFDFVVNLNSIG